MWDARAFARSVQEARRAQGLTQEQLGERVGVSAQAVSKWENAESCPEVALLPQVCAALEVSADTLLSTAQHPGVDALVRALRERLGCMAPEEEGRRRTAVVAQLLAGLSDDHPDAWAGQDFLCTGRAQDQTLRAATLFTRNGGVLHIHGTADLPGQDVPDAEIGRGLATLADPTAIAILRRLVPDAREGAALRAETHADAGTRAACDRLVEGGYLELRRDGYGLTPQGLLVAATILLLAQVPGLAGELRRVRWISSYDA